MPGIAQRWANVLRYRLECRARTEVLGTDEDDPALTRRDASSRSISSLYPCSYYPTAAAASRARERRRADIS